MAAYLNWEMKSISLLLYVVFHFIPQGLQAENTLNLFGEKQELELYEKTITLTASTDYLKTSGVIGILTGHFSQAHENNFLKQVQKFIVNELNNQASIDLNLVQLLPPTIENSESHISDSYTIKKSGFLGSESTDYFSKYDGTYSIRVSILYPGSFSISSYESKGRISPSIRVEYINNDQQWVKLGVLEKIDPNLVSLGVVDLSRPDKEVSRLNITNVNKKYRFALGSLIAKSLSNANAKQMFLESENMIRVIMDFKNVEGKIISSHVLESTDKMDEKNRILKALGVKGLTRFFDRYFYTDYLNNQFKSRFSGVSSKCSNIF